MVQRYSNTASVPLSIGVFLATDHYDHNDDPLTISTTTLIKPLRQIILSSRVPETDGTVELMSMTASRIGTSIHSGIELAWSNEGMRNRALESLGIPRKIRQLIRINPTPQELAENPDIIPVYMEQRLTKRVGKWIISGKFDFVGQGRLEDFKSTSTFVVMKGVNDEKFAMQGSIYRWMDPTIITNPRMAIQFIIKDWMATQARANPAYPQAAIVERLITLKPVEEIQQYVERKLALIEQYWDAPEEEIPQCTDAELSRSEPVFKYYSDPAKASAGGRSTKNFDEKQAAYSHMAQTGKGTVKEVPGMVTSCRFCSAFPVCTQKDALVAAGDLVL